MADESRTYRVFAPDVNEFRRQKGEFEQELADENTKEHFQARIVLSDEPLEGYDLLIVQSKKMGSDYHEQCYVKIVERVEEDEEAGTIFRGQRLGQRRGYMLESMLQEREQKKKDVMTTQLEERLKKKQELLRALREEQSERTEQER